MAGLILILLILLLKNQERQQKKLAQTYLDTNLVDHFLLP